MNKRFLTSIAAAVMALCLLAGLILPAAAVETTLHIRNEDDWEKFSEHCIRDAYSRELTVSLDADLDFSHREFTPVPSFSGSFEGNHHTLRGIRLEVEGSHLGLFRYLTETALVKDLNVEGQILPQGTRTSVGGIAGTNAGVIRNCSFRGECGGLEAVGGMVGTNEVSGILEQCSVTGRIHGSHFAGGLAGDNCGTIRDCRNLASVNDQEQDNTIEALSFKPEFFTGKEAVDTSTDLGGIAGTSTGVIRSCENHGTVGYSRMGYNVGGIAGSQKGYLADCKNYGHIYGRKEVAGIAGQLEPIVEIEYTEDTLQILRGQLDVTASLANRASANIRSGSDDLAADIRNLHSQAGTALDAIDALFPGHGKFPDRDTIIAANNALSSSISSMQGSVGDLNNSAQSMVGTAAGDIRAITNQVSQISRTLDHAAENLGGTITDISDLDTPEDLGAKIHRCENHGKVDGDFNVGGIAGAAAWENDLEPEDDYSVSGDRSLNMDSRLRAVILDCTNAARISATKRNVGGIVGNLNLGLVKGCINTGFVEAEDADLVGGIAGTSLGFLRSSAVKCKLRGHSMLGGIAGSASVVTDCRSTVMLDGAGEQIGSVLGTSAEDRWDSDCPISGNYYVPLAEHIGAVDGIDYEGMADSLGKEEFLALEDLPGIFRQSTMTFRYPDGQTRRLVVPMGDVVKEIPEVPPREGYLGTWDQLEDLDLSHMFFNVTLEPVYEPIHTVVQSDLTREDGKPILLAEGQFEDTQPLTLERSDSRPDGHDVPEVWILPELPGQEHPVIHLCVPDGLEDPRLLIRLEDGSWEQREAREDGCYLVFPLESGDREAAVYASGARQLQWTLSAVGGIAVIAAILTLLLVRKKHKKA